MPSVMFHNNFSDRKEFKSCSSCQTHSKMHTGFCYILLTLLTIQGNERGVIQLDSKTASLSFAKEVITNTISIVHLQTTLMIKASERDFPFNISSNSQFKHIRYPQSYRTTLVQVSSLMHQTFSDTYATMYRIQLASKRIPGYVKTIVRLLNAGSPTLIERMLPTSIKSIARISEENEILINKTTNHWTELYDLVNEIKQLPLDFTLRSRTYPSDGTDLIPYNRFEAKNALEKMCIAIENIQNQFKKIAQFILNLNIKTQLSSSSKNDTRRLIPILYHIETSAYFLYQLSSLSTNTFDRYILRQTAGMGKYALLSTDEDRHRTLSKLSAQLTKTLHEIEQSFIEHQNEFDSNNALLRQMYEKLFSEFIAKLL